MFAVSVLRDRNTDAVGQVHVRPARDDHAHATYPNFQGLGLGLVGQVGRLEAIGVKVKVDIKNQNPPSMTPDRQLGFPAFGLV